MALRLFSGQDDVRHGPYHESPYPAGELIKTCYRSPDECNTLSFAASVFYQEIYADELVDGDMIDQSLQPTTEAGSYCQAMQRTRQAWCVLVCLRWRRIVTRESILDKERIRLPKTSTILCSYWPSVTPQRKYVIIIRCHNRQESAGIIEWCAVICCAGARFIRRDTRRRF